MLPAPATTRANPQGERSPAASAAPQTVYDVDTRFERADRGQRAGTMPAAVLVSRIDELLPKLASRDLSYFVPTMRIIEPVRASKMPTSTTMPGRRWS